jgi:hypothetical protein
MYGVGVLCCVFCTPEEMGSMIMIISDTPPGSDVYMASLDDNVIASCLCDVGLCKYAWAKHLPALVYSRVLARKIALLCRNLVLMYCNLAHGQPTCKVFPFYAHVT